MNSNIFAKANRLIKTCGVAYIGVIDENGCPSVSAVSTIKPDGIFTVYFATGISANKSKRLLRDETGKVPGFWDECHKNGSYERLYHAAGAKRGENGLCCINAVCGYSEPGDDSFPYMICALKKSSSNTDGFKVAQIPKTTWAVFRSEKTDHIGIKIPVLFNRAYSEWLPSSGYDKAVGPDMEIYYTTPDGKHFEEVWIPVKKG